MKETAKEPSYSTDASMIIYKESTPIIVIEVKTVVPAEFEIIKPSDCIKMLIYCLYIMRISKLDSILGCLTDGIVWHALKITRQNETKVFVNDYMRFASTDYSVILNTIPNLLNCL